MSISAYSYDSPGTVSAVFFTKKDADKAYQELLRMGHKEDEISVLMSDETLNKHTNPPFESNTTDSAQPDADDDESTKSRIVHAIISITSLISLPSLGIAISRTLMGTDRHGEVEDHTLGGLIATKIPEEHCNTYESGIREGGIIISVDPRNIAERNAIVKEFKLNSGHDILGDDGYTEMD